MRRNTFSPHEKMRRAQSRMEEAACELLVKAERLSSGCQSYERASLLAAARLYASKVDALTRVRK